MPAERQVPALARVGFDVVQLLDGPRLVALAQRRAARRIDVLEAVLRKTIAGSAFDM
jgi:hypothetical protein